MDTITRRAAKTRGLKYYFTGKPCKRGHLERRYVSSFLCMECARETQRKIYNSLSHGQRKAQRTARRAYYRQWAEAHRDEQRPKKAARNKAFKDERPDCFRNYYSEKKDKRKRESREWYQANAEYAAERQKAYDAKRLSENPEHVRALARRSAQKRRAIQREVFVEVVDPRVVFDRDAGICGICGTSVDRDGKWEVDHVIPLSRGGEHSYSNVQLAHRRCNRAKCNRMPDGGVNGETERQGRHGLVESDP